MDFAWEVSRSLAACQGAVLLVRVLEKFSIIFNSCFISGRRESGSPGSVHICISQRQGQRAKDYSCLE